MKRWTIAFQHNTLTFVDATVACGDEELDDSHIEDCFAQLVQGKDDVPADGDRSKGRHLRVLCRHGIRQSVQYCMTHYIYVRAAGGVVQAPDGRRLLIWRNDRWDLPKGGVEIGETLRQAAAREVMEETGMHHLDIGPLISKTYHIYNLYGGWHLKQTSWFAMTVPQPYPILPQREEGIACGEWVDKELCLNRLSNSYATMQMLARRL